MTKKALIGDMSLFALLAVVGGATSEPRFAHDPLPALLRGGVCPLCKERGKSRTFATNDGMRSHVENYHGRKS